MHHSKANSIIPVMQDAGREGVRLMNRLVAGSRSKDGFNVCSAGTHGLENARMMLHCDENSVIVDVYTLHGDIHIDLWLSGDNGNRPSDKLLYSGKLFRILECSGLCWQPKLLERIFSEAAKLREEAVACETVKA